MKITKASDYAIRLLVDLAGEDGVGTTSEELAEKIDIPFNHMSKIVQILGRRGYLLTRKGKGGGISLAKDPKNISLAEVIEAVEGPMTLNNCIFHVESCRFGKKCKVRKCLGGVQNSIVEMLSAKSIYEMAAG